MAQSFQQFHLSGGSGNGTPIVVAEIATPGTLIHTSGGMDNIWLWAANIDTVARLLTIEWGGVTSPGSHLVKAYSIPAASDQRLIAPGIPLANALIVRAFADSASKLNLVGFVIRVT